MDVPMYESDNSETNDQENIPKRSTRNKHDWFLEDVFNSKSEALDFVKNEKNWSIKSSNNTVLGIKTYYRCNKVMKRNHIQCNAAIYLFYRNSSQEVELHRSSMPHNCDKIGAKQSISGKKKR
ncbi:hypothetical protein BLOT_009336 [Blomia tropicalis]|nr:hypothetical protein BLOT_009336 [Blomia tropicalis]